MTFSALNFASIFSWTFHEKWPPKWSQNRCQNHTMSILGGQGGANCRFRMLFGRVWKTLQFPKLSGRSKRLKDRPMWHTGRRRGRQGMEKRKSAGPPGPPRTPGNTPHPPQSWELELTPPSRAKLSWAKALLKLKLFSNSNSKTQAQTQAQRLKLCTAHTPGRRI